MVSPLPSCHWSMTRRTRASPWTGVQPCRQVDAESGMRIASGCNRCVQPACSCASPAAAPTATTRCRRCSGCSTGATRSACGSATTAGSSAIGDSPRRRRGRRSGGARRKVAAIGRNSAPRCGHRRRKAHSGGRRLRRRLVRCGHRAGGADALWGTGSGRRALAELGLQLGADVPVFVRGHNAWAEGVGETADADRRCRRPGTCWSTPACTCRPRLVPSP